MDLTPSLAQELERVARNVLRRHRFASAPETLSLMNRACERMLAGAPSFESRAAYLSYSARVMRNILYDIARRRRRLKRGGGDAPNALDSRVAASDRSSDLVIDVAEKLDRLARYDPKLAQLVELRFFGGFGWEDVAEALAITPDAARRDWQFARRWLRGELDDPPE